MTDSRISKLQLDLYATGELSPEEARVVRESLDDRAREHLLALEQARAKIPPVDVVALRARAASLEDGEPVVRMAPQPHQDAAPPEERPAVETRPSSVVEQTEEPAPANVSRWRLLPATLMMAAAVLLLIAGPRLIGGTDTGPTYRTGDALTLHQAVDGLLQQEPYRTGTPVGHGDILGFRVNATDRAGVVLLSVDGTGAVSVFYPASGDAPLTLEGEGFVPIGGTVRLDDTAGREVFVAVFDRTVSEAVDEAEDAFSTGGHDGLLIWATDTAGADAVEITRP